MRNKIANGLMGVLVTSGLLMSCLSISNADQRNSSEMSILSLAVVSAPVGAALFMSTGTAELIVASVEASGEVSELMIEDLDKSLKWGVAVPKKLAEKLNLQPGDRILAKATEFGHVLEKDEIAIAIAPNSLGKQLILDAES
ncbi:AbrB/MazE/SpoVT family DNA-binding domain-containing protein [Sneathiella glossodoripedis]|uniref:AbrB/MazE/SpoVT family DNA-binding domain-containing protein n=1 Tax=Sneathiella glossodoripedis TaxID=418853 RepID=UPI00046EDB99|nr:AbrB/MazE/SpoVT family DNA-binding domain-containing protein [Sneathiella glossodoripedis]